MTGVCALARQVQGLHLNSSKQGMVMPIPMVGMCFPNGVVKFMWQN